MCYFDPNIYIFYFLYLSFDTDIWLFSFMLDCIWNLGVFADVSEEQGNDYESFPSWDNGGVGDGEYDGDMHSDIDDPSTLISQPRRVGLSLLNNLRLFSWYLTTLGILHADKRMISFINT